MPSLPRWLPPATCGLIVGLLLGGPVLRARQAVPPGAAAVNPQENRVLADLYMQSAEYRACCLQTYKLAAEKLAEKLKALPPGEKRPAVVMDLDETVLDNAGFETWLYKNRLAYAEPLWDPWERDFPHEVQLVPGAKLFIGAAELAGVTVVYLSNRSTRFRDSTVKALALNGLNTDGLDERLLLKDNGSDKTGRRAQAEQRFRVLLYFGDNLRDFDEAFKVTSGQTTFESRARLVD